MADDYYATLGVSRDANADEIHKAYRKLARQYHPDLNPDDDAAKRKFQEIQQAYEVLKDPKKREMFDRFGPSFDQMGGAPGGGGGPWRARPGAGPGGAGYENVDLNDIFGDAFAEGSGGFADLFRQFTKKSPRRPGGAGAGAGTAPRGAHLEHELQVPFRTAVSGGNAQISVRRSNGRIETINVKVPAGIEDGKKIRLRGQGDPGPAGGQAGDILITVRVASHPSFHRQGRDLIVKVPVSLHEAVLGAKIDVPTPKGTITLTVPPGTSSGKRLRIKGHGVQHPQGAGDLFAELQIILPESLDDQTRETIRSLQLGPSDPRVNLAW
jgi:DnaJ-class molecular chaperone